MRLAIAVVLAIVGCAEPTTLEVVAHGAPSTITTDHPTYTAGQTIVTSWTGLPGNANDWVAIAPAGSPATTVTAWAYTTGAMMGMRSFPVPANGSYVARAFVDDSYNQIAESAAFTVGSSSAMISTDQTSYTVGQPVVVSWSGLPGNANDWIAIAPSGSGPSTITRWVYTNGAASGMRTFGNIPAGNYVARAFLDNSYTLLAETSTFNFGAATNVTVTSDKSTYIFFEDTQVIASWTGMPPGNNHWIALAEQGAPLTTVLKWKYTNGQPSGSVMFEPGTAKKTYVLRAFLNDVYTLADESDPFTFGARITTNKASYAGGENITATWSKLPNPFGDPNQGGGGGVQLVDTSTGNIVATQSVNFSPGSFTFQFGISTPGTYVATIGQAVELGRSAPFTVVGNPVMISAGPNPYQIGFDKNVGVTYVNLPGPTPRWVSVAPLGSPDTTVIQWKYIQGATGTDSMPVLLSPGMYVVRAFVNDDYQKVAESSPFVAQ